jgi:hypothetical protein
LDAIQQSRRDRDPDGYLILGIAIDRFSPPRNPMKFRSFFPFSKFFARPQKPLDLIGCVLYLTE